MRICSFVEELSLANPTLLLCYPSRYRKNLERAEGFKYYINTRPLFCLAPYWHMACIQPNMAEKAFFAALKATVSKTGSRD
jgi:hypothetical protein